MDLWPTEGPPGCQLRVAISNMYGKGYSLKEVAMSLCCMSSKWDHQGSKMANVGGNLFLGVGYIDGLSLQSCCPT